LEVQAKGKEFRGPQVKVGQSPLLASRRSRQNLRISNRGGKCPWQNTVNALSFGYFKADSEKGGVGVVNRKIGKNSPGDRESPRIISVSCMSRGGFKKLGGNRRPTDGRGTSKPAQPAALDSTSSKLSKSERTERKGGCARRVKNMELLNE